MNTGSCRDLGFATSSCQRPAPASMLNVVARTPRGAARGRHAPELKSVWLVAPLVLLLAGALSLLIYQNVYDLLAHQGNDQKPRQQVNVNDVIRTTVTILTLIGAVLAGIYAYRKQLLAEGDASRADARQLADRYSTAAEQLGHTQPAVRLAGVYALARLADDWPEQRQVCIDVLCAYIRMPYESAPTAAGYKEGEREVRHSILRVIRDHLQDPDVLTSWCPYVFDFTDATFDGGDLSSSHFLGRVTFDGAEFSGGQVSFYDATFSMGRVSFIGATLNSGTVSFVDATFAGGAVSFEHAVFAGSAVSFAGATFSGTRVTFDTATFSGSTVTFDAATFGGGVVSFQRAMFNGGTVTFHHAGFGGDVSFTGAEFGDGLVSFEHAVFASGTASFEGAKFARGTVSFGHARFRGSAVPFDNAKLTGSALSFRDAKFSDGPITFTGAAFGGGEVDLFHAEFNGATVSFGYAGFCGATVTFDHAKFAGGTISFGNAPVSDNSTISFDGAVFSGAVIVWGRVPPPPGLPPTTAQ